jgi:Uncharacterised protein family (UPF0175)
VLAALRHFEEVAPITGAEVKARLQSSACTVSLVAPVTSEWIETSTDTTAITNKGQLVSKHDHFDFSRWTQFQVEAFKLGEAGLSDLANFIDEMRSSGQSNPSELLQSLNACATPCPGDKIPNASQLIHVAAAVHLYDLEHVSLGLASQLAGMPRKDFVKLLAELEIPVIRTSATELAGDLARFER